jgi:tryptophan 2,3-dioxygenase
MSTTTPDRKFTSLPAQLRELVGQPHRLATEEAAFAPVQTSARTPSIGAACPHRYAKEEGRADYCTFIGSVEIEQAITRGTETPDERLVVAFLADLAWWAALFHEELCFMDRAFGLQPFSSETYHAVLKSASRCVELGNSLDLFSAIIQQELLARHRPEVRFRLEMSLSALPHLHEVASLSVRLRDRAATLELAPQVGADAAERELLLDMLAGKITVFCGQFARARHTALCLLKQLEAGNVPLVPFEQVVPIERLLALTTAALHRHFPGVPNTDPRLFVESHQVSEAVFNALVATEEYTIHALLPASPGQVPHVFTAAQLQWRCRELMHLARQLIHAPETMPAWDYIVNVRRRLIEIGGGGAESIRFHDIEIGAGLKDKAYRKRLARMRLLTPGLEARMRQPSVNEAILALLERRGIIAATDTPDRRARKIASILLPTGTPNPYADLVALIRAALAFDEEFMLWREDHEKMTEMTIGRRPSVGAGGKLNYAPQGAPGQMGAFVSGFLCALGWWKRPVGGASYLRKTKASCFYPDLRRALEYLQEHWQGEPWQAVAQEATGR